MSVGGKPKHAVHGSGDSAWLLTYADMITLLMALFLLMFSMSDINPAKFEANMASISEHITGTQPDMPIQDIIQLINNSIAANHMEKSVDVTTDGAGIVIEFRSSLLFAIGEATINESALPIMGELVRLISDQKYARYGIEIEGHTDDVPIYSERFPSNWELSAARAANVTKLFVDNKVVLKRLRAIGYAEGQPKVPNRAAGGAAIAENQAINRRVVIRLYPQTFRTMSTTQQENALDLAKKAAEASKALEKESAGTGH
jgi:chemotaxis protein MotB